MAARHRTAAREGHDRAADLRQRGPGLRGHRRHEKGPAHRLEVAALFRDRHDAGARRRPVCREHGEIITLTKKYNKITYYNKNMFKKRISNNVNNNINNFKKIDLNNILKK